METETSKVGVAQPVSMPTRTKPSPPKSGPIRLLDLPNEVLHKIFIRIPFESNQLCKLMLVNSQIREYITENKAQIIVDIAEVQFPEQAVIWNVANNKPVGGGSLSHERLIDLARSDNHVKFVFEKTKTMLEPGSDDNLALSVLLDCLHIFEGLHHFDFDVDLEIENTLFVTMLRWVLAWLRLSSTKVSEVLQKHLARMEATAWIYFFGLPGVELASEKVMASENIMVKHGLGPIANMLNLTKSEYSETGELAQANFIAEVRKVGKTENMMWSWARHNVPDFRGPLSADSLEQTTTQATWGSEATAALVLKYFSGDIMDLDRGEPMKEGFAGLMQRCDAFPHKVETSNQDQAQLPPDSLVAVAGEDSSMRKALMYDWARFAARGIRDGSTKLDDHVWRGYKMSCAALGPLLLVNHFKAIGFGDITMQIP